MPYGNLVRQEVQRFADYDDLDEHETTIEEREEYEPHIDNGVIVYAGVDYEKILRQAEQEVDIVLWDGGNNDFPFFRPDVLITVVDPLRPGHELKYHPGEANLRMADVIVINKIDAAEAEAVGRVIANIEAVNPRAQVVRAASPVVLEDGPSLVGSRVLVIDDGPTLTHGGMPFGAGTVAARQGGALELVDPRPFAVGSVADVLARYPHVHSLPAMGYSPDQLAELEATINASECDVVVTGTPIDLGRLIDSKYPIRHARYELREIGSPTLEQVLAPLGARVAAVPALI